VQRVARAPNDHFRNTINRTRVEIEAIFFNHLLEELAKCRTRHDQEVDHFGGFLRSKQLTSVPSAYGYFWIVSQEKLAQVRKRTMRNVMEQCSKPDLVDRGIRQQLRMLGLQYVKDSPSHHGYANGMLESRHVG
jgi:hypothetical protein